MRLRRLVPLLLLGAGMAWCGQVPRPSPDFAVNMSDGRQMHVSEYKGKVVVLAFILTTCPHCQFTTGVLTKLQQEYGPRGFQVLGSAIEDMAKMNVPDFIRNFQPSFPVGFIQREMAEDYLQHPPMYRLLMPQVVVIDRKGTIRAQLAGDDRFFERTEQEKNFRNLIEPLLKEGAGQTASSIKK